MDPKKDFFVSYNHNDAAWAEWIAWQLEEAGFSTVVQAWDFGAGSNFVLAMQDAAVRAGRTIAVLSPDYLESEFAASEWAAAFAQDPTGAARKFVPVRVRECQPEGLLSQVVYVDFVGLDEAAARERLLRKVTPGRGKPARAPAFPGAPSAAHAAPNPDPPPFPGAPAAALPPVRRALPDDPDYLFWNVPQMPRHFVGRDGLVAEMVRRLVGGTDSALSARGQGGVGKTTLAVAIAHQPEVWEHFTGGILWAGLGPGGDVMSAMAGWGDALKVDLSRYITPERRVQAVRNAIGARRMLLVVDDAWEQGAALAMRDCGGPNCVFLLTTRDEGVARAFAGREGAEGVPELPDDPAFELLRTLAPEACEADSAAARELARAVGGLPLALELLGAYLAAPERSLFPDLGKAALDELSSPEKRLKLAQKRLGALDGREVSLQDAVMLSLNGLPKHIAEAFCALGVFAPKPEQFDREAAEAVTGVDSAAFAALVTRSLVESAQDGAFSIHQTVAEVARTCMPPDAVGRHSAHYLSRAQAMRMDHGRIAAVYAQITQAFQAEPDEARVLQFIWALNAHHRLQGLWANNLGWMQRGLNLAEQSGDLGTVAILLNNIGLVYDSVGDRKQALEYLERALPIMREVGHRAGEAVTLNNIGLVYDSVGDRKQALEYYERALPIRREVGHRAGEATTLNNIGSVYNSVGNRKQALEYFERALPIMREVGDRAGEAITLSNIGGVYDNVGDRKQALEYYERALPIRREVGDRAGEATTLNNIGSVYIRVGEQKQALEYYERALPIAREVGDRAGEATTLTNIGLVYDSVGDRKQALEYYERALPIRREVGDRAGEAVTLNNIGLVYDGVGDRKQALECFEQALPIMREVGDRAGEATTLNNIGGVYYNEGDRKQALEYFEQALPIRREVGDRAGAAVTRFNVAFLLREEGQFAAAVEQMRLAVELMEAVQHSTTEQARTALAEWERELAEQQKGE